MTIVNSCRSKIDFVRQRRTNGFVIETEYHKRRKKASKILEKSFLF
ncbi:MAG: hypothetical protein IJ333_08715 [Clostridia bacterium]|nr:hypothetical protein [Clostridia bacterium]